MRRRILVSSASVGRNLLLVIAVLALAGCSADEEAGTTTAPTNDLAETETRSPADGTNLITNGDFETGSRGWTLAAYGGAQGRIARTTSEKKRGDASLALTVTTPGDIGARFVHRAVRGRTTHTVSAWVKSPPGTTNGLRVIGAGGDRPVSPAVAGDGTWKRVGGTFTTGARETAIEIRVMQGGAPATSYIDGVQLDFEHRHSFWSHEQALERAEGARINVDGRTVTLQRTTLTCGGDGRSSVRNGVRVWAHFECLQSTFPPGGGLGPDAIFRLHVVGPRDFVATDARLSRY